MAELEKRDLMPCGTGEHNFAPIGEPHRKDGVVQRVVIRAFCTKCSGTTDITIIEGGAPPMPPVKP